MTETDRINHKQTRCHGIDLLRIVAAFYIIILHILGRGGLLAELKTGTVRYTVLWFMEIWAYCAVNIFAMVSGYVGYKDEERPINLSSYAARWLQVVFYGVLITFLYQKIHPDLTAPEDYLPAIFPVANNSYWYFTAYTGLFFFKPLINSAVRNTNNSVLTKIIVIAFFLFTINNMPKDQFVLSGGYSFVWLAVLYLFGAYIKKTGIAARITGLGSFAGLLLLSAAACVWKISNVSFSALGLKYNSNSLISYTSPTVTLSAFFHLVIFSKLSLPAAAEKTVSFLSPGVFAVYLINVQKQIWDHEMKDGFVSWAVLRTSDIVIRILVFSFLFVIISLLIDKLRQLLFRAVRIQPLIRKIINRAQ